MKQFPIVASAACAAALLSGTAAVADVTAQQVWDDWKANMAIYGDTGISIGGESASGGQVTVSGLTMAMDDGDVAVNANMGDLIFTENGDGTVNVTMSESFPIVLDLGRDGMITITVSHSGMDMNVSGSPEQMNYAVSANRYTIAVTDVSDDVDAEINDAMINVNGLEGTYVTSGDTLRNIVYAMSASSLDILFDMREPGGDGVVSMSGKLDGLSANADISVPEEFDPEHPENMFADGFAVAGSYGFDAANYIFNIDVDEDVGAGTVSIGQGSLAVEFNSDLMAYSTDINDLALSISSSELPFPVEISLGGYGIGVAFPLSKTDEPADFAASFNITDLAVSDMIWSMIDPGNAFSHEPATARIDLSGTGKLLFDVLDPEQAEALARSDMPGELHSLNLNDLAVIIAGASLTGTGGFTFDNTDLESFDGLPRPEGKIDVELKGANQLIDTLVSMGMIPEQEAMGARMFMGMFARTVGDDQLTSTLEIDGAGAVYANGQRIQ